MYCCHLLQPPSCFQSNYFLSLPPFLSFCLSIYLSPSLSFSLSHTLSLSLSYFPLSLTHTLPLSFCFSLFVSLFLTLTHTLSLSFSLSLSLSLTHTKTHCLSLSQARRRAVYIDALYLITNRYLHFFPLPTPL